MIRRFDIEGKPLLNLPEEPSIEAVRKMLSVFGVSPTPDLSKKVYNGR